jgi:hypothetical protein
MAKFSPWLGFIIWVSLLALVVWPAATAGAQSTPPPPTPTGAQPPETGAAEVIEITSPDAPPAPAGFQLIDAGRGAWLYRKPYANGSPDFVQVIDLRQGAHVELLHGALTEARPDKGSYGGPDPRMKSPALETYWQDVTARSPLAFCVINGGFFYMPEYPTRLAFPLKVDGQLVTEGWGVKTYVGEHLILELWEGRANIQTLTKESLYASSAPNLVGGLTEDANKRAKFAVGRTFAGVDDRDGDGSYETVLFLSTRTALQSGAASVLRDFGADQVMMLDGGGSTQLLCRSGWHVRSDRPIPQALAIFAGETPEIAAEITRSPGWQVLIEGERTPFEVELRNTGTITWTENAVQFVIDPGPLAGGQALTLRDGPTPPGATAVFSATLPAFHDSGVQGIQLAWRVTNQAEDASGAPLRLRAVVLPATLSDQRPALERAIAEWSAKSPQEVETRAIEWLAHQAPTLAPTQTELVTTAGPQINLQNAIWIPALMLPIIIILALMLVGRRNSG